MHCILLSPSYLPADTQTHKTHKCHLNSAHCWVPIWRLKSDVEEEVTKVNLQYGSVHLKGFTTAAKFFANLIHSLLCRLQAAQRQLAIYCPGQHEPLIHFHCAPLKSFFPRPLLTNSHRAWGHTDQQQILKYSDKDRERKGGQWR